MLNNTRGTRETRETPHGTNETRGTPRDTRDTREKPTLGATAGRSHTTAPQTTPQPQLGLIYAAAAKSTGSTGQNG